MEADRDAWTPERPHPWSRHALDAFGPDRALFGGDWPIPRPAIELPRWSAPGDEAVSRLDEPDRRMIFAGTARRVHRPKD